MSAPVRVVALSGGIGGAKLALGLYGILPPDALMVVCNTGDDFEHLGLRISPDIDTVLYTLGGVADPERGWGRADETWNFMSAVRQLGGETWFQLGDRDLAMHVARTKHLHAGGLLTDFVELAARQLGIDARILPMTDEDVRTIVETDEGSLEFQRYFVEHRCQPRVRSLWFAGASRTRVSATVHRAIFDATRAICDATSIDPLGLLASGALLAIVAPEDAARVITALRGVTIPARAIGEVELGPPRVIMGAEQHAWPEFDRDELARYFATRNA